MAIVVRELVTTWGFDVDDKPIRQLEKNLGNIKRNVVIIGAAAVASAAVLFGLAKSSAALGTSVGDTADKLGLEVETLQELRFAAATANIAQTALDIGVQRFTRRAAEAAKGTGEAKDALKELGVQLTDTQGNLRPIDDLLNQVADGLKAVPSQADRVRLSFKLFDTEGVGLVNILAAGSENLNRLRQEARDTGTIFGVDFVKKARAFEKGMEKAKLIVTAIRVEIGQELLPIFTDLLKDFTLWFKANRAIIKQNIREVIKGIVGIAKTFIGQLKAIFTFVNAIVKAFGGWEKAIIFVTQALAGFLALRLVFALGGAVQAIGKMIFGMRLLGNAGLIAQVKLLAIPLAIGLAIVALALLVEDFIAFTEGKDSVLGRMSERFNKLGGTVKRVIALMMTPIRGLISAFRSILDLIDTIKGKISIQELGGRLLKRGKNVLSLGGALTSGGPASLQDAIGLTGIGPSTAPVPGGATNVTQSISVGEINVPVQGGANPQETAAAAASAVNNEISQLLRGAGRDLAPVIQR